MDLAAVRSRVAEVMTSAVPDGVAVYPYPPGGVTSFPAVIVGQPGWAPGQNYCLQQWTVAVTVVVQRPGIDDEATIAELEQVWPALLATLQAALDADQTLGGLCAEAHVARARGGQIQLGNQTLPAQSIELELLG